MSSNDEKPWPDFQVVQNIDSMSVEERIAYFQQLLSEFEEEERLIDALQRSRLQAGSTPEG
jgi:hypothetical protein